MTQLEKLAQVFPFKLRAPTGNEINDLSRVMNNSEFKKYIGKFLRHKYGPKLTKKQAEALKCIIDTANYIYNSSGVDTGLTDSEYDTLCEYYINAYSRDLENHFPVKQTGKASHLYPTLRGTLDKIYYLEEGSKLESDKGFKRTGLPEWIKSSQKQIEMTTGMYVNLRDEEIYVFPKFDGESVELNLDEDENLLQALTRGDTETNTCDDITHQIKGAYRKPGVNLGIPIGLKTEAMMSEENFELFNERFRPSNPYRQSRSAIASILHSKDPGEKSEYITLMHLRYSFFEDGKESFQKLPPGAFSVPYIRCRLGDTDAIEDFAQSHKYVYVNGQTYRCDGAVLYIINPNIQRWLGRKDNKQKFEVAYKFTEEIGESVVKDVSFQVGKKGAVTPVLKIKPIRLKGNTIKSISLHSMNIFLSKGICKGDKVEVKYDIVPLCGSITPKHKHDPFMPPIYCPICKTKLEYVGSELWCPNNECPSRTKGQILDYLTRMRIKGIGENIVDDLFNAGIVTKIEELYRLALHVDEIKELGGYGDTKINNMIDEINSHRSCPKSTMLGSIGIKGAGIKTFQKILQYVSYDELLERAEYHRPISDVPGIGQNMSDAIMDGIRANKDLISFLEKELEFTYEADSDSIRVAFTQCRPTPELLDEMTRYGAVYDESFTKKTNILVVPTLKIQSSKLTKAVKYEKPIVVYDKLIPLLQHLREMYKN